MSSSSKRQSIAPSSGPKPPVNFSSSLTIPKDASLTGHHSITIQAETVIHPRARIDSTQGSVLIGRRCVIQERAQLGAQPGDRSSLSSTGGITLGDYVIVEAGATVEPGGTEISEGTFIQVGSTIGRGAKVGKVRIRVGLLCDTTSDWNLELHDFSQVYSPPRGSFA
jgi:dynactin-6